jgi:hypothetical protein
MAVQKRSRLATFRARVKRIWSELRYANRRMFYVRTGERFLEGEKDSNTRAVRRTPVPGR